MPKVIVIGAGGFGTALALLLAKSGNDVTLWGRDASKMKDIRRLDRNMDYPWQRDVYFRNSLTINWDATPHLDPYDFAIIAVPSGEVGNLTFLRDGGDKLPALVFVQKGVVPESLGPVTVLFQDLPTPKLLFTGAALAKDIVLGASVEMLITHQADDAPIAKEFAKALGQQVWPRFCSDFAGVSIRNALRTVVSFQDGAVAGYLRRDRPQVGPPRSTLAAVFAGISKEARGIAKQLGVRDELLDPNSEIGRIFEADLILCQDPGSRNYELGALVGEGFPLDQAARRVTGTTECLVNLPIIVDRTKDAGSNFPWLQATADIVGGGVSLDDAVAQILSRHQLRLE